MWELKIIGGGGGLWYFGRRPTKLECEQRIEANCGESYTLRYLPHDGRFLDSIR